MFCLIPLTGLQSEVILAECFRRQGPLSAALVCHSRLEVTEQFEESFNPTDKRSVIQMG